MKKTLFIYIALALLSFAQHIQAQDSTLLVRPEIMPRFPGGDSAFQDYIRDNMRYPKDALENNIQGKVAFKFTVDTSGGIRDIQILTNVYPSIDAEAKRLIENMPRWAPGSAGGRPVKVIFSSYLTFSIASGPISDKGLPGGISVSLGWQQSGSGQEVYLKPGLYLDANFHGAFVKKGIFKKGMLEFGSRFTFSQIDTVFQRKISWQEGRSVLILEPFFGNRWPLFGNTRANLWMGAGIKCHLLSYAVNKKEDKRSPMIASVRPYVGLYSRVQTKVRHKNAFLGREYLGIQCQWTPFWGREPFTGSMLSLGVGWEFQQEMAEKR